MKRRQFFERLGLGSAAAVASAPVLTGSLAAPTGQHGNHEDGHDHDHGHDHGEMNGAMANATVSFGAWRSDLNPPLDRYPNSSPAAANEHQQIPHRATIDAGGSVNFIISGLHQIVVYGPGKRPEDVNTLLTRPTTGVPAGVPLINDPDRRVYAGPDPSTFIWAPLPPNLVAAPLRDRVEVVHFPNPGRYLVICGVLPHFQEGMFGWVRVLRGDHDD